MPMAAKLDRVIIYSKGVPDIKSHNPFIFSEQLQESASIVNIIFLYTISLQVTKRNYDTNYIYGRLIKVVTVNPVNPSDVYIHHGSSCRSSLLTNTHAHKY